MKAIKKGIKKFVIEKPEDVIKGIEITKEKRHEKFGKVAGGAGAKSPEKYQREMIEMGTGVICAKTNMRIDLRKFAMVELSCPNKTVNGFDFSEDFDGLQKYGDVFVYINLKCVVGSGGSQTRSLREVYWFIQGQLNVLIRRYETDALKNKIYFANILDGDEAAKCESKYEYLLGLTEYKDIRDNVYVGDLHDYYEWIRGIIKVDV